MNGVLTALRTELFHFETDTVALFLRGIVVSGFTLRTD